jgi:Caspase domain
MPTFNEKVKKVIPAEFHMISSASDHQISNEAYNTGDFELPNPAGKEGGMCTTALLQVLYEHGHDVGKMSWVDILRDMRETFVKMGFDQSPVLSSSRWIDVNKPMFIVPPKSGRRRAIVSK